MAKVERGQLAPDVLNSAKAPGYNFLQSPLHVKQGAVQWFYGGPGISTVGINSDIEDDQTGVFVDGHDFGVTQGTGKVELADGPVYASANKIQQTVTAWSDWRITITVDLGAQSPGVKYYFVTDGNGAASQPKTCWVHRATAIKLSLSADITAGAVDATTNRLTAPTGTFEAGERSDDTNPLPAVVMAAGEFTEDEFSYVIVSGAINGASYEFRMVEVLDDGTVVPYNTYTVTPQITIGGGPITTSVLVSIGFANRNAIAKVGLGSVRGQAVVTERVTTTKVGLTSLRAVTPVTSRATQVKIALGSTRSVQSLIGVISGSPVSNTIQTSLRASVTAIARISGSKLSSTSVLGEVPVVMRPTHTKVGLSSIRGLVPTTSRSTTVKIGLTSLNGVVTTTSRTALSKIGVTTALVTVPITKRTTAVKTIVSHSFRAVLSPVARITESKIATSGTVRTISPITALVSGTSSNAVQTSLRAVIGIIARVTGSKTATGNLRVILPQTQRATQSKIASGSVIGEVVITPRTTVSKIAASSLVGVITQATRSLGFKLGLTSIRVIQSASGRSTASKLIGGSVRVLVPAIFRPVINLATQRVAAFTITARTGIRTLVYRSVSTLKLTKNNGPHITISNDRVITTRGDRSLED
jgi:hypothetical protein